jgi:hypothetical protein
VSENGIAWRRVSSGLYLAGFGTVLLLITLGRLPWSFWLDALSYWPIALIALGIRMIFERSRTPWLILLSPLLVLGTLAYVALDAPGTRQRDWVSLSAERPKEIDRWSFEGDFALVDLDLTTRPLPESLLVDGRSSPPGRRRLLVNTSKDEARVRLRNTWWRKGITLLPGRSQGCEMALSEDLPLKLDLDVAFSDGRIDLSSGQPSRVWFDGAFNDLTLRLGSTESEIRVTLEGAFNQLKMVVPSDTPVRVSTDTFLNFVDREPQTRARGRNGYRVVVDGAFNRLVIRSPDEG